MAATIPGAGITTPLDLTTADTSDTLTLTSTEAGADNAPILKMYRNSSSPADSDYVGLIKYVMRNDNSQDFIAAQHYGYNVDVSDGTEDGGFAIDVMKAGTVRSILTATGAEAVFNNGSQDIDFRVESDSNANCFTVNAGMSALGINADTVSADYPLLVSADSKTYSYIKLVNTTTTTGVAHGVDIGISGLNVLYYLIENGDHIFYNGTTPAERFRIATNGDLTATDTSISSNSDQRLKKDIVDHTYDISKFKQFKPRSFAWINPEAHTNEATTGFVAQEVESVDGDWASSIEWEDNDKTSSLPKYAEEKALCNNEDRKTSKLGKKDAMYISVIQQLITRIEALESA